MTERKFRRVEPEFVRFLKEGDSIEGILLLRDTITFQNREASRYTIETDTGDHKCFLGSTIMDRNLTGVPIGTCIRITFLGKEQSKSGQPLKKFTVEIAED